MSLERLLNYQKLVIVALVTLCLAGFVMKNALERKETITEESFNVRIQQLNDNCERKLQDAIEDFRTKLSLLKQLHDTKRGTVIKVGNSEEVKRLRSHNAKLQNELVEVRSKYVALINKAGAVERASKEKGTAR